VSGIRPSPPRDFESLRSLINERRAALPKRLEQVARYALDHPDEVAFGTTASIAVAAKVQPSTLVRFAHQLDYDGFSDLQRVFQARLRDRQASYEERLRRIENGVDGQPEEIGLLGGFLAAARRSLEDFAASADLDRFGGIVSRLARAQTIYLIARRRSYPLAAHMAYACGKLGIRNQLIACLNGTEADIAALATPRDAALAISFAPYADESIALAEGLSARGVPVVAITDSAFSPLANCASAWVELAEADYAGFRSLSAGMALATALPVAIAEARRKHPEAQDTA